MASIPTLEFEIRRIFRNTRPPWYKRLWRELTRNRSWRRAPVEWLTLVLVGGRGQPSLDRRLPRIGSTWIVAGGVAENAEAIEMPFANRSAHWLLIDGRGSLLAEGRFRKALDGYIIPKGALRITDWS